MSAFTVSPSTFQTSDNELYDQDGKLKGSITRNKNWLLNQSVDSIETIEIHCLHVDHFEILRQIYLIFASPLPFGLYVLVILI